jgi:hypothetical protein
MHTKTDNCSAYTQWQEVLLDLWMSLSEVRTVLTQHITSFSCTHTNPSNKEAVHELMTQEYSVFSAANGTNKIQVVMLSNWKFSSEHFVLFG